MIERTERGADVELSASELHQQERFGGTVAEAIVGAYEIAASLRASGRTVVAKISDVGTEEIDRVVQLVGALFDAGFDRVCLAGIEDTGGVASLAAALQRSRVDLERIEFLNGDNHE